MVQLFEKYRSFRKEYGTWGDTVNQIALPVSPAGTTPGLESWILGSSSAPNKLDNLK